jgi:methylmalonyl-CoA carboxyltransferase 12S subunit
MTAEGVDWTELSEALGALRHELARLGARVAALEAAAATTPRSPAPTAPSPRPMEQAEGLSEELVLVISAAIAAFLGKKHHVRQIRLLGTRAWGQQGRVTIQASHDLPVRHG